MSQIYGFGDLVRQHLSRRGLTQNRLAEVANLDPTVLSAMCNGRRLSGAKSRSRILAVIRGLRDLEVLSTVTEANALLAAAGKADLSPATEAELLLDRPAASAPDVGPDRAADTAGADAAGIDASGRDASAVAFYRRSWFRWGALAAILLLVPVLVLLIRSSGRQARPYWEEDFDPLSRDQWLALQTTGIWEDLPGPTALLKENDPAQDFGKVETVPLVVDVEAYPLLRVAVAEMPPDASYTVQVLDKETDQHTDVIKEVMCTGEQVVDLTEVLGWQGVHTFTINIWVGGEAKAIRFDRVSIEPER